jgi:hypothetical protein
MTNSVYPSCLHDASMVLNQNIFPGLRLRVLNLGESFY